MKVTISNSWQSATTLEKITMVAALVYMISPIDFVPEAIFGLFGLVDDFAAFAILIKTFWSARSRYANGTKNSNAHPLPKEIKT